MAVLALLALPGAAMANDWLYAPVVAACFASGEADCIGEAATMCMTEEPDGETTVGMMSCLMAEHQVWDGLLNAEYTKARDHAAMLDAADAPTFPAFAVRADQVRDAQRAWIAFRDANCAMQYGLWGAGSMRQIAGADCVMRMTATQTIALRDYHDTP